MDAVLKNALQSRASQLGKNVGDLTPGQIAEVEADPLAYLTIPEPEPDPDPEPEPELEG